MGKKRDKQPDTVEVRSRSGYDDRELERLQSELAHLRAWAMKTGARIVVPDRFGK